MEDDQLDLLRSSGRGYRSSYRRDSFKTTNIIFSFTLYSAHSKVDRVNPGNLVLTLRSHYRALSSFIAGKYKYYNILNILFNSNLV